MLCVYNSGGVGVLKGWNGIEVIYIKLVVNCMECVLVFGFVCVIVEVEVIGWEY